MVNKIDKNQIRSFILYLQRQAKTPHTEKPLSSSTVQGYIRTLKVFFSWLLREEYIRSNPMTRILVPRAATRVINTFSHEHINRLATLCHTSNGSGYRNLTIIFLPLSLYIILSVLLRLSLSYPDTSLKILLTSLVSKLNQAQSIFYNNTANMTRSYFSL